MGVIGFDHVTNCMYMSKYLRLDLSNTNNLIYHKNKFLTPVYQLRAMTVEHAPLRALPSIVLVAKAFFGNDCYTNGETNWISCFPLRQHKDDWGVKPYANGHFQFDTKKFNETCVKLYLYLHHNALDISRLE